MPNLLCVWEKEKRCESGSEESVIEKEKRQNESESAGYMHACLIEEQKNDLKTH